MPARFHDGREARAHPADVAVEGRLVHIAADGREHRWPLNAIAIDRHGGEARLSWKGDRDARLILPEVEWIALAGAADVAVMRRGRRREIALVGGLAAAGAAVAGFVFFGMPVLSGPLARATPAEYERRMGENFDAQIGAVFPTCGGESGQRVLRELGDQIGGYADTTFIIEVRAVQAPMINAFALPGGPILITDDLIRDLESPDELAAVVAHEVAHIEQRHVMQAVWRLLGMGMVLDAVVGGGSGAGQQAVLLAGQITDLNYSRVAEVEADARGMELLHARGMSSRGMASFFARLEGGGGSPGETGAAAEFLSTHPDGGRRVRAARAMERSGASALDEDQWAQVKAACETGDQPRSRLRGALGGGAGTAEPN